MVDRSLQFEQAISGGDKATLLSYCQQQEQQSPAQEAEMWQFLRLNIEDDARRSSTLPPPPCYHGSSLSCLVEFK